MIFIELDGVRFYGVFLRISPIWGTFGDLVDTFSDFWVPCRQAGNFMILGGFPGTPKLRPLSQFKVSYLSGGYSKQLPNPDC